MRKTWRAITKIRVMVKRILRECSYPPDLQDTTTRLVLEPAELIATEWTLKAP